MNKFENSKQKKKINVIKITKIILISRISRSVVTSPLLKIQQRASNYLNKENFIQGKLDAEGHLIEHYGRRCHGLINHHTEGLSQCRYRFQFKSCPHCQAENDIAARTCQDCHFQLVDADDILKKALSLHKAKVLRCAGIVATIEKAKVTIRYIDEDGSELTEHFYLNQKHSRDAFNQIFARRLAKGTCPINVNNTEELAPFLDYLPHPDFVIAQQHNHIWQVQERIFDYHGPYRKANQLS
jgi:DNA repair protein RadD